MSEFPSLPLFTDSFIADTGHLTAHETGAYMMLLMVAWRMPDCRLPDDDAKLARWARVEPRHWPRTKSVVMGFWTLKDGFWSQKRLTKERDFVRKHAAAARANGGHGGRPPNAAKLQHQRGSLMHALGSPDLLFSNGLGTPLGFQTVTQPKPPNPNPIEESSSEALVPKAAREEGREGSKEIFGDCRVAYSEEERRGLALTFDGINVDKAVEELERWCDKNGIANPIDRKNAIYGALKKRHARARPAEAPEPVTASPQLAASRLAKRNGLTNVRAHVESRQKAQGLATQGGPH
jgi:uncharacterized protein YdaU (DUF1376 family)